MTWLRRYVLFIVTHPRTVIIAVGVASLLLAVQIRHLRIYVDPDASLPLHHPYVQAEQRIRDLFGGRKVMAMCLVPRGKDIWNPETLTKVKELTEEAYRLEGVLSANVLSLTAEKVKDIRGTPEGLEVRPLMAEVPRNRQDIEGLKQAVQRNPLYLNTIVAADGRAAAVYLDFQDWVGDEDIFRQVQGLAERYDDESVDIYVSGLPAFVYYFSVYARQMAQRFTSAFVVIMVVLYLTFRSFQGMILPLVTAILSVTWGVGIMALTGVHMDGWNSMTPILIMAVAAGHSIQILRRYYEEYQRLGDNRLAVVESTVKVGVVMLTAGGIAAASFASLMTFPISTIRSFGLFTAIGILSALAMEMTFIPAARVLLPAPRRRMQRKELLLDGLLNLVADALRQGKARWAFLAGAGVLMVVSFFGAGRIVANNSMRIYLPAENPARVASHVMKKYFGGFVPYYILVSGKEEGAIQEPAVLHLMADLQERLHQVPGVSRTQSLADVMKQIHRAMNGDDPRSDGIPDQRRLIAQYLLLYSLSGDPGDFDRYVDPTYSQALIWSFLRSDDTTVVQRVIDATEEFLAAHKNSDKVEVEIGGGATVGLAINNEMTRGKIVNIVQIALFIFVASGQVFRSPSAGLFVLSPLVLAVLVNFAVLGFFHIWLNMGTATISAMAVGIGADYAIYLIYRYREELRQKQAEDALRETLLTSGKAVVYVAAAISAGYGSLLFGALQMQRMLGILVPLTMLMSCLGALTVMPALLLTAKPAFLFCSGKSGKTIPGKEKA